MKIAGHASLDGHVKGDELIILGKASIGKDCEVEHFTAEGHFTIAGLLNAEQVDISIHGVKAKPKKSAAGGFAVRRMSQNFFPC
ncbi:hypothetical protein QKW52_02620 [Bacillus sonorensis]|nr:hypothetical protein [Bacillus sonorensis]